MGSILEGFSHQAIWQLISDMELRGSKAEQKAVTTMDRETGLSLMQCHEARN